MSIKFEDYVAENPEVHILSEDEIALIKIKLGKSHRKESDWAVIKDILMTRDLITITVPYVTGSIQSVRGIVSEEGKLIVFTNFEHCKKYIFYLQDEYYGHQYFQIATVTMEYAVEAAQDSHSQIYIDPPLEGEETFIIYDPDGQCLKASFLAVFH